MKLNDLVKIKPGDILCFIDKRNPPEEEWEDYFYIINKNDSSFTGLHLNVNKNQQVKLTYSDTKYSSLLDDDRVTRIAVSYTHLTLPTICSV